MKYLNDGAFGLFRADTEGNSCLSPVKAEDLCATFPRWSCHVGKITTRYHPYHKPPFFRTHTDIASRAMKNRLLDRAINYP